MTQAQPQTESSTLPSAGDLEVIALPLSLRNDAIDAEIKRHLEPAIARSHGTMTIKDAFELIDQGLLQVFLMIEDRKIIAVSLTRVVLWGSGKKSLICLQGGGLGTLARGLNPIVDKMEAFAVAEGCDSVRIEGRSGWGRVLPDDYGYSHSVFEKELV